MYRTKTAENIVVIINISKKEFNLNWESNLKPLAFQASMLHQSEVSLLKRHITSLQDTLREREILDYTSS